MQLFLRFVCTVLFYLNVVGVLGVDPYTEVWQIDEKSNYKQNWWNEELRSIPRIIWQTYSQEIYPIEGIWRSINWIRLNKKYSYRHISDLDFQRIVLAYFHPDYHDMLLNHLVKHHGRLSDFTRFLSLFLYGGFYCDMDCFPILGMEKWPHYPFENTGIIFSMEGVFAEQFLILTQPRHPLIGQFMTVFMDTFIHDKKILDERHSVVYGGPGMWLLAIFSLCDMNPRDSDTYTEEIYNNGRDYAGLKPGYFPNWVFEQYRLRDSKFRKCCDYYDITIVDKDTWLKWPFVHNKRQGGWQDNYSYWVQGVQHSLKTLLIKDVLAYSHIFSDEYRYSKITTSAEINQSQLLQCQAQILSNAYNKALTTDKQFADKVSGAQCEAFQYGVINYHNTKSQHTRFLDSDSQAKQSQTEDNIQYIYNYYKLNLFDLSVPWIHLVAFLLWIRVFQLRQNIQKLTLVPFAVNPQEYIVQK